MFGDWMDAVLSSNASSYHLDYFCCVSLFFLARMWRSVSGPSDLPCPQAVITTDMFPQLKLHLRCPLSATQTISLSSQATKMPLQSWCWRNFSSCLLSAGSVRDLCGGDLHWMHKITKKIHTCDECAGVFCSLFRRGESENMWGFTGSWLRP